MRSKSLSLVSGLVFGALAAGGLAWAVGVDGGSQETLCRTKAGYLRVSSTGECRRAEVAVELPRGEQGPQGEAGAQGEPGPAGPAGKDVDPGTLDTLVAADADVTRRLDGLDATVSRVRAGTYVFRSEHQGAYQYGNFVPFSSPMQCPDGRDVIVTVSNGDGFTTGATFPVVQGTGTDGFTVVFYNGGSSPQDGALRRVNYVAACAQ